MNRLKGKIAVITGGNSGVGAATAKLFAAEGATVVITARREAALKEVADEITAAGGEVYAVSTDISKPEDPEMLMQKVMDKYGKIDILVNNAGIRRDNVLFMMPEQDWHDVINTSLNGFYYVTRKLLPKMMMRKHGGRIVNMASLSGIKGMPGQTNYSAAKAALIGATKALAQEVASRNVTVNAVAPGFIETDMTKDLPQEQLKDLVPMKRFGKPAEVAALVGFICSEEASYITGEVISINGGLYT